MYYKCSIIVLFINNITSVPTLFEQIQLVSRMCLNVIGEGFVK